MFRSGKVCSVTSTKQNLTNEFFGDSAALKHGFVLSCTMLLHMDIRSWMTSFSEALSTGRVNVLYS